MTMKQFMVNPNNFILVQEYLGYPLKQKAKISGPFSFLALSPPPLGDADSIGKSS